MKQRSSRDLNLVTKNQLPMNLNNLLQNTNFDSFSAIAFHRDGHMFLDDAEMSEVVSHTTDGTWLL